MSEFKDYLSSLSNKEFLHLYIQMLDSLIDNRVLIFSISGINERHHNDKFFRTVFGVQFHVSEVMNWIHDDKPPSHAIVPINIAYLKTKKVYVLVSAAVNPDDDRVRILEKEEFEYKQKINGWKRIPYKHWKHIRDK